ncbi:helix-turn-helix domain-containing protein [Roseburia sp. 831b]|uniref:helix-turn-helix domain-containing protein n=1 Tax=Roseburia sp. 831b TaxID=1261635 RepID=UPI00095100BF|nr:helix-turn-helix domain-containing protein [Roseburia sp. 831b]WVK74274.1 helix-turn-helix domain-containing protein [Roseburia sp. 831b]
MGDYSYERYAKIRDFRGFTDYKVTQLAGIKGTATISNWKNGKYTPKDDKMQRIADALEVSLDFLNGKTDEIECKECGQKYNPLDEFDCAIHEQFHTKILKAKEKYKCLLPYNELVSIRYNSLEKIRSGSEDIATELNKYLKAEFSHYVYMNYEDSRHYDFFEFAKSKVVEMINNGDIPQDQIDNVAKWYKLDKEFINIQGASLARASKNPQLMRLLAYAEKLNPEMLNMLEIQAKALSEQNKKEE